MKKKILYIDYLSPEGHVGFNKAQINSLVKLRCELYYVFREGYSKKLGIDINLNKIVEIPNSYYKSKTFIKKIYYYFALRLVKKRLNGTHFDAVIFSSYETISLSMFKGFRGAYIINHNNIRDLDNRVKRFFYKEVSDVYKQVVFNSLMKNKLQINGINNVFIIPHGFVPTPSIGNSNILCDNKIDDKQYIFFPSKAQGTENVIRRIVGDGDFVNFCNKRNIKIVIRFNSIQNPSIINISGYLSTDDYYTLLINNMVTILCYESNFTNRVSGVLFECMALNVPSIIFQNDSLKIYNKYSAIGKVTVSNTKEMCCLIENLINRGNFKYYQNLSEISESSYAWKKLLKINDVKES